MVCHIENLLFSFFDNRTLRVYENGTILSSILYDDATDDQDTNQVSISQFAGDIGTCATEETVAETIQKIQQGLDLLEQWCKKWFVTLNPLKYQLVTRLSIPLPS